MAAAHALEHVGMPEARYNLAEAALYLARAPKSNSVTDALEKAMADADSTDPVPSHLRDAHYAGAAKLGHGEGYQYPHDFEGHHVEQQYRPERFEDSFYYEPTGQGGDVEVEPGTGAPVTRPRRRGTGAVRSRGPAPQRQADEKFLRSHGYAGRTAHPTDLRRYRMTLLALTGGETALIVLAAFWGLLVVFLCLVLLNTFRVLEATRLTVDAMREETVPLLREIKGSVERTNGHLDRLGGVLDSVGGIVGRVERFTGLIEHAASSPIVKFLSVGAGVKKAAESFGQGSKKKRSKGSTAPGAPAP